MSWIWVLRASVFCAKNARGLHSEVKRSRPANPRQLRMTSPFLDATRARLPNAHRDLSHRAVIVASPMLGARLRFRAEPGEGREGLSGLVLEDVEAGEIEIGLIKSGRHADSGLELLFGPREFLLVDKDNAEIVQRFGVVRPQGESLLQVPGCEFRLVLLCVEHSKAVIDLGIVR